MIRRSADGLYLDWADLTFKGSGWTTLWTTMAEFDPTNLPGGHVKTVDLASFLDGKYQVFGEYAGSFSDYADTEFMVTGGLLADIQTSTAAISWLSRMREALDGVVLDIDMVMALIRNKKEIKKEGTTWYLMGYDDVVPTPNLILKKPLKDSTGADITDAQAGALMQELPSVV